MNAKKLPSGSWRAQVQINGKRYSFTRKTKKQAEAAASECVLSRLYAPESRVSVLIDKYIADRYNVLSASTVERYKRIHKRYLPRVMSLKASELTAERLQEEINEMAITYSPKTVRAAYGLISAALGVYGIRLNVKLPPLKRNEYNVPTEADVFRMIDAASGTLKRAILLAAFCGLRRGEIIALDASDIDGNKIHIRRAAVYDDRGKLIFKQPKTYHSDRYITAPDIVINELRDIDGRVCPVVPSAITSEFIRLRDALGLKCRFHDLRHFFASYLHALGARDQYIIKAGGWRSDFMLKSIYRNTLDDVEARVYDTLNQRINAHETHTDDPPGP